MSDEQPGTGEQVADTGSQANSQTANPAGEQTDNQSHSDEHGGRKQPEPQSSRQQTQAQEPQRREPNTGNAGDGDDGRDWRAESRKWEDRSKRNKSDLDAATQRADQAEGLVDALRKALDPQAAEGEDAETVAERATQERDAKDAELRSMRLERAAEKAARKHGADVDALLDSRQFLTKLGELDPSSDDLADELDRTVTDTLQANPRLKAEQPKPARSVTDGNGSGHKAGQLTRSDLQGMTPDEITQARKDGRLDAVMKGT